MRQATPSDLAFASVLAVLMGCTGEAGTVGPDSDSDAAESPVPGTDEVVEPAYTTVALDADTSYPSVTSETERALGLRIQVPVGATGPRPVIAVSHGGLGAANGETFFDGLGAGLAAYGFVVVQIGHRPTPGCPLNDADDPDCIDHFRDRPADVRAALDALVGVELSQVAGTDLSADLGAVAHTGHSGGAYTSLAVGGAAYGHDPGDAYRDPRVLAIAPISSQGLGDVFQADAGTFGAVEIPTLLLFGGEELDTNGAGDFVGQGWRMQPFEDGLYSRDADRIAVVVAGQDHEDMGGRAGAEVIAVEVANIAAFFAHFLEGRGRLCAVGTLAAGTLDLDIRRQPADGSNRLRDCP